MQNNTRTKGDDPMDCIIDDSFERNLCLSFFYLLIGIASLATSLYVCYLIVDGKLSYMAISVLMIYAASHNKHIGVMLPVLFLAIVIFGHSIYPVLLMSALAIAPAYAAVILFRHFKKYSDRIA